MGASEFAVQFSEYAGKNHGYNTETSAERMISESEISEIYKLLWTEYAIDDLLLFCHACQTCRENNPEKPFHLGSETLLDLELLDDLAKMNPKAWTEERIGAEKEKRLRIKESLKGLAPKEGAGLLRQAYSLRNVAERAKAGLEPLPNVKVLSAHLDAVKSLGIEEVNAALGAGNVRAASEIENGRLWALEN